MEMHEERKSSGSGKIVNKFASLQEKRDLVVKVFMIWESRFSVSCQVKILNLCNKMGVGLPQKIMCI